MKVQEEIMSEEFIVEDPELLEIIEEEERPTTFKRIAGYFPMLTLSLALHMVLFLLLALIREEKPITEPPVVIVTPPNEKEIPVDVPPEIEPIKPVEPILADVENTVDDSATQAEDVIEIVDEPPIEQEKMDEPFSEIPVEAPSLLTMNNLAALTQSGSPGQVPAGAGIFGDRFEKKTGRGTGPGNATAKTENAVDAALRWLAEHQEPDGYWDAEKYEGHFKWGNAQEIDRSVMTAMAVLPFLGAGHTERTGKYKKTVQKAIRYINQSMSKRDIFRRGEGHFTRMYGSGLVLMALSETCLFGSSKKTEHNANLIAEYLIDVYLKKPGQGWSYTGGGDDFSVSGWVALGLKSARYAGLQVMSTDMAAEVMDGYRKWTHEVMTDPVNGVGKYRPGGGKAESMTLVGMFAKQFLGYPINDPFLTKAAENVIPRVGILMDGKKPLDVYQIYYGTLAAYQQNGDLWRAWDGAMKSTLLGSQRTGSPKQFGGSWDPTSDHTGKVVGRVGTTALMALCLEVYYRFGRYSEGNG